MDGLGVAKLQSQPGGRIIRNRDSDRCSYVLQLENLKLLKVLQSYKLVYGHKLIELEKNLEIFWT